MGGCSLKAPGVTVKNENVDVCILGILYNNTMFAFSRQHTSTVCICWNTAAK